ncbi:hypothetical protein IGI72_003767 [Enterococcus sp. DIV1059_2]|nr:hypothetical protein A5882_003464 [Enterococcus sp. 4E1_DIV0656]
MMKTKNFKGGFRAVLGTSVFFTGYAYGMIELTKAMSVMAYGNLIVGIIGLIFFVLLLKWIGLLSTSLKYRFKLLGALLITVGLQVFLGMTTIAFLTAAVLILFISNDAQIEQIIKMK